MSVLGEPRGVEARLAAEIARTLTGPTLVVGEPLPGLVEACWERIAPVGWVPLESGGIVAVRARRLAIAGHETMRWEDAAGRRWQAVLFARGERPSSVTVADLARVVPTEGRLVEILKPGGEGLFARRAMGIGDLASAGLATERVPLSEPGYALDVCTFGRAPSPPLASVTDARCAVTVVIPSAGVSLWLDGAIASVLEQTLRPARILLVSDGGGDGVRDIARRFGSEVELLEQPRAGQAAAMNAAIARVETEHVAWLDDDDLFLPRKLELQWPTIARRPDVAFGITDHYVADASGTIVQRCAAPRVDRRRVPRLLLTGSHFLGPTAIVRTADLRALGDAPYDVTLPRAADHAMWFELVERGDVAVFPLALTLVRRHAGNASTPARTAAMREAARRTIRGAIERWPLEVFYPEIHEAGTAEEERELHTLARLERAGYLIRIGLVGAALADLDAGIARAPDDARLLHFRALALLESAAKDEAAAAFERAARAGAPAVEVACGLGTLAYWRGDREEAARQFRRALAADPRSLLARYNLGLVEEAPVEGRRLSRDLLGLLRLPGFLLSPKPPLDGVEAELVRLRRLEAGLDSD